MCVCGGVLRRGACGEKSGRNSGYIRRLEEKGFGVKQSPK